jgi:hypothetical protein
MKRTIVTTSNLRTVILFAVFATICGQVRAQTVFFQDFENGLGANESTFGAFTINNANAPLNNGTQMMGHPEPYGALGGAESNLPTYSYYDVTVDLSGNTGAELTFDFVGGIEKDFDGFNVLASATGAFDAPVLPPPSPEPNQLIFPTAGSGFQYDADALVQHGSSSPDLGPTA